ncbi:DUF6279 family lipoprotein [Marinobacter confluentis]|uniref:DUF3549 domain-containing protein n=1 Tax=Marinobacter confluentis TaxID=1697557 RepID=A0A4Z1C420_9GAMM|nr:DUF6279 family lipoprotein [Marinobacter confluentis]TGN41091.1 DUF3549 domain-containing protein [Marinobacter confluentis]
MESQLPRRLNGNRTLALFAALSLLLLGCSSTKLAYRYADWGIVWWVDDYIPLTGEQQAQLERDVVALRDWHCSTQLPRYSEWLTELKQDVRSGDLNRATIEHHQEQLFSFFPPLLEQATPMAARLLASLSDGQVQALAGNMADSQAELEEEFLGESPELTRLARAERTMERVEQWLGPLSTSQAEMVTEWSDNRGRQTEIWLEGRRNWQKALLAALKDRDDKNFTRKINALIIDNDEVRGADYQRMMTESRQAMAALMASLIAESDQQQRDHLLDRAANLRGDFNTLACNES